MVSKLVGVGTFFKNTASLSSMSIALCIGLTWQIQQRHGSWQYSVGEQTCWQKQALLLQVVTLKKQFKTRFVTNFLKASMKQQRIHLSFATVVLESRECNIRTGIQRLDLGGKTPYHRWWNEGLNVLFSWKHNRLVLLLQSVDLQITDIYPSYLWVSVETRRYDWCKSVC